MKEKLNSEFFSLLVLFSLIFLDAYSISGIPLQWVGSFLLFIYFLSKIRISNLNLGLQYLFLGTIFTFYTGILKSKILVLILSTMVWDIGQIIFAFSTNYYLSVIVLFLIGFSAAYWVVAANLIFQNETSEKNRNKIMAIYQFVTQIFFIGWLVGGLISDLTNAQIALVISGLSSYPIFIIALIFSKRLRIV